MNVRVRLRFGSLKRISHTSVAATENVTPTSWPGSRSRTEPLCGVLVDRSPHTVFIDVAGQCHVQLNVVGLKFRQPIDAGISRAEVINCRLEADTFVFNKNGGQVGMIADAFAFAKTTFPRHPNMSKNLHVAKKYSVRRHGNMPKN